jgi:ubiquinone biosynthesis protein COQ4
MKTHLRKIRGILAWLRLIRHPDQFSKVFEMADGIIDPVVLLELVHAFGAHPDGARALEQRPTLGSLDLEVLRNLPDGTLGRAYADHMTTNRLDHAALPAHYAKDPSLYVRAHLYESHDIWHVVTGFKTDVNGELGLQAFNMAQYPSRVAAWLIAGGLLNAVLFSWVIARSV